MIFFQGSRWHLGSTETACRFQVDGADPNGRKIGRLLLLGVYILGTPWFFLSNSDKNQLRRHVQYRFGEREYCGAEGAHFSGKTLTLGVNCGILLVYIEEW